MTLNNLVDNIFLIARNNNIGESEHLSRYLIMLWINYYRAALMKAELDAEDDDVDDDIDDAYYTTIEPMFVTREENVPGNYVYHTEDSLPTLMKLKNRPAVRAVRDMYGNIIQLSHYTKSKYQKYRKATCRDYIAWLKDGKIYIEGDSNQLEFISVDCLVEDPLEDKACYDPDSEYPISAHLIPQLVKNIITNELLAQIQMPSDTNNNGSDELQNRHRYDNPYSYPNVNTPQQDG